VNLTPRLKLIQSLLLLGMLPLAEAGADTVFKCQGADGRTHYQSSRCLQANEVSHWAPREFTAIPYKPASLVIPVDGSLAYRVNGEINGSTVNMTVDTGAAMVSIPQTLADKLKLVRGQSHQFSTANGLTTGYRTTLHTLKVGDFTLTDVDAAIMSNLPGGVLLGQTALGRLKVEQAKGELRISAL
jgi:clan AA aspartic protease (TIGR02281 family)